jgi:hypothetical protein
MKKQNKKGVRPEQSHQDVTAGFERLCSWDFHFAVEAEGPLFNSLQKLCQPAPVIRLRLKNLIKSG